MPFYRIYMLTPDGQIKGPAMLGDYPDDAAVLRAAEQSLTVGQQAEIWQESRLVDRVLRHAITEDEIGT